MSDLKVTPTTEAVRVARTSPDGGRQQRQASSQREGGHREAGAAPRGGTAPGALRVEWDVAEDGALRIRLLDARGRMVAEVTPEELLAQAGGDGRSIGLLLQAQT